MRAIPEFYRAREIKHGRVGPIHVRRSRIELKARRGSFKGQLINLENTGRCPNYPTKLLRPPLPKNLQDPMTWFAYGHAEMARKFLVFEDDYKMMCSWNLVHFLDQAIVPELQEGAPLQPLWQNVSALMYVTVLRFRHQCLRSPLFARSLDFTRRIQEEKFHYALGFDGRVYDGDDSGFLGRLAPEYLPQAHATTRMELTPLQEYLDAGRNDRDANVMQVSMKDWRAHWVGLDQTRDLPLPQWKRGDFHSRGIFNVLDLFREVGPAGGMQELYRHLTSIPWGGLVCANLHFVIRPNENQQLWNDPNIARMFAALARKKGVRRMNVLFAEMTG